MSVSVMRLGFLVSEIEDVSDPCVDTFREDLIGPVPAYDEVNRPLDVSPVVAVQLGLWVERRDTPVSAPYRDVALRHGGMPDDERLSGRVIRCRMAHGIVGPNRAVSG